MLANLIDPTQGRVVREPEGAGPGYWAGAPTIFHDDRDGAFYLCYRLRRPRGIDPDRGYVARIARSTDGVAFDDVAEVTRKDLDTLSIEKCALIRADDGRWHYFVSSVDAATGKWRIDSLVADSLDRLDPDDRQPVFTADDLGLEGVKDPWVVRTDDGYVMLYSAATPVETTTAASHTSADIYNTGDCRSVSGLAVSPDLETWTDEGIVFEPAPGQWDGYCARLNGAVRFGGAWWAPYDGAAGVDENYEERCGLAASADLRRWKRFSTAGPSLVSPHGSGSLRYAAPLIVAGAFFAWYEFARDDGAHDLRVVSRDITGLA